LLAWALLGGRIRADQIDPIRGALGALGFMLHALAWGAPQRVPDAISSAHVVAGPPLVARTRPSVLGPVALVLGAVIALAPPAAAFGVERPGAALLAHAVALVAALLCIVTATDIALRVARPRSSAPVRTRARRALWPLSALSAALVVASIWAALR
jgi:hypothetical protein